MNGLNIQIQSALSVARFLWPGFVVVDDMVFLKSAWHTTMRLPDFTMRMETEILINHLHILDQFEHGAGLATEPWWNHQHADFRAAWELGEIALHTWAHKLRLEFPGIPFILYLTRDDNPILRFHRIRAHEPLWLDPMDLVDIPNPAIRILTTSVHEADMR